MNLWLARYPLLVQESRVHAAPLPLSMNEFQKELENFLSVLEGWCPVLDFYTEMYPLSPQLQLMLLHPIDVFLLLHCFSKQWLRRYTEPPAIGLQQLRRFFHFHPSIVLLPVHFEVQFQKIQPICKTLHLSLIRLSIPCRDLLDIVYVHYGRLFQEFL